MNLPATAIRRMLIGTLLATMSFFLGVDDALATDTPIRACPPPKGIPGYEAYVEDYESLETTRVPLTERILHQVSLCQSVSDESTSKSLIEGCINERSDLSSIWGEYEENRTRYRQGVAGAARQSVIRTEEKIAQAETQLARTRRELSGYAEHPEDINRSMMEWATLGAGARERAMLAAKDAVISMALQGLAIQNKAAVELTQAQQSSVRALLKEYGPILKYAKQFADQRLANLTNDAAILKTLSDIHTAAGLSESVYLAPDDREQLLTAIAKILSVLVKSPELGLLLSSAGIVTAASTGWTEGLVSEARVGQLMKLSESRLRAVHRLSWQHEKEVRNLKELKNIVTGFALEGACWEIP